MIPYDELVAALDRYVARGGGTVQGARVPASAVAPGRAHDEPYDPHLAAYGNEDPTAVGGADLPPPLSPISDEHSNEIDIGDVLADDEI
jgi:hypothetical protein